MAGQELVAQQRPNTSLNFVACSGATTTSLMSSQISAVNSSTNNVSVTIGGNDTGFASLILQCTLLSCNTALNNARNALPGSLNSKLDTVYTAIRSRAPGATVVVLGYPRMFSTSGCFGSTGIRPMISGISRSPLASNVNLTLRSPVVSTFDTF